VMYEYGSCMFDDVRTVCMLFDLAAAVVGGSTEVVLLAGPRPCPCLGRAEQRAFKEAVKRYLSDYDSI